jgi:hypothetical protein
LTVVMKKCKYAKIKDEICIEMIKSSVFAHNMLKCRLIQ